PPRRRGAQVGGWRRWNKREALEQPRGAGTSERRWNKREALERARGGERLESPRRRLLRAHELAEDGEGRRLSGPHRGEAAHELWRTVEGDDLVASGAPHQAHEVRRALPAELHAVGA